MRKNIDMLNGSLYSGIIRYTIPIILTSILQLLFNAADLVIVGQYCGSISVAAVSATGSLTSLMVNLFMGISIGAGVAVAHGLGSQQNEEVCRTVHTALPTAIAGGALVSLTGVIFAPAFLEMMGTPSNVLPLSAVYMRIYFAGMTFNMVYNFSASILRAAGDTRSPLIFLSVAGVLNVLLNIIFVTVFNMNVAGVALATTVSQAVSAVLVVIQLTRRTDACRFMPAKMRFYSKQLLQILRIGLPAGIQNSLFAISNVIIQSSVNSFHSDAIMSGNGAAQNIEGFVFVTMDSFCQTTMNYIGQNTGAHKFHRVKKIYFVCLLYVFLFGLITGGAAYLFSESLLSIYITDSPLAISYGITRMTYLALPYFLCGLMNVTTGALRGLGCSFVPMVISIIGACGFRIAWIYTIFQVPQYHTLACLYQSYPVSWVLTFAVEIFAFILFYKKKSVSNNIMQQRRTV